MIRKKGKNELIGIYLTFGVIIGIGLSLAYSTIPNYGFTIKSIASISPPQKVIEFTAEGVNPKLITIKEGETITFLNKDVRPHWPASDMHPIHTTYPERGGCIGSKFDACKGLEEGETYSFTFTKAGNWRFHDHLNPITRGTIVVESENGQKIEISGDVNLTEEEIKLLAQELIAEGFLPTPEICAQLRPYNLQGKRIAADNEGIRFLISQDPAYPNGIDANDNPIIPEDLTPEQKEIYIDVLYGGTLDWKKIARDPANNQKALGGCIYCNAPAGAGGCFKKQVLRGLVYNLVKLGWDREEIRQEADFWMRCIFGPDPFLAWGIYYKKIGKDPSEIGSTIDKLSRYGRSFVLAELSGDEVKQVLGSQACGV